MVGNSKLARRVIAVGSLAVGLAPQLTLLRGGILSIAVFTASVFTLIHATTASADDTAQDRSPSVALTPEAIVEKAIDAQGARDLRSSLKDLSLSAEVLAAFDGNETEADVKQFYKVQDKFRMETHSGLAGADWQTKAYDGSNDLAWETAKGRTKEHRGRSGHQDREKIKSDLAELKRMLRYFFLSNLPGEGVAFRRLPDISKDNLEAYVIERTVTEEVRKKTPGPEFSRLKLFFDISTYQLLGVEIPGAATAKGSRLTVCFWGRVENVSLDGKPASDTVWIPKQIEVYEENIRQSRSRLRWVKINSGLKDSLFHP